MSNNNRAPTYDELVAINNEISARLHMHKFATSHEERAMLKERSPGIYEKRRAMLDQHGAAAYTLSPVDETALRGQKRNNINMQTAIASKEGADAEARAAFWEGCEKTALVTRNVATGALVVVGTVATGGALAAGLTGAATIGGVSAATLTVAGTVAFTGVTVANLSGKIAAGKQLDGGDYAELLLTVLPFGAGKAGLLLKETLGAARAAKATKLIQEAQRLAQAEKTPVGKAVEKVLQRTAAGREAVSDFVTGCRNRVIKPSSGLGKILEESKALKGAQQEAKRLQNMMRQNMKDQKRLQQITDQLGKLKAKHPGIAGDIDPKLMKDLQKKGITLTNSWTAADGKVMATGNNLSNSLRNVAGNAGKALNTPLTRRTAGAAGVVGAYGLGARGSQSNVPNGSAPEDVQRTYYASLGNLGEPPALGTETPVLPPAPQVFPIAPEVETYHTEINNQLQQTGFKVATNTEAPQQTSFDAETQTVKTADLSKLNSYWQQVSLTFREQLIGKTPEAIAHMTGEGKAEIVTYIREALKSGIDKTEMSAHINGMLNGESAGARIVPKVHQPDGLSNSSASGFLGDSLQFNNPTSPTQPGVGGRVVPPQNDPNLFPPRVDGLPPVQQPQYTNTQNPNLAPV